MSKTTTALRLPDAEPGSFPKGLDLAVMSYWKQSETWMMHFPPSTLGTLVKHTVVEHDDGTITVTPSIKVTSPQGVHRHGFLTAGVWHPCGDDRPPLDDDPPR